MIRTFNNNAQEALRSQLLREQRMRKKIAQNLKKKSLELQEVRAELKELKANAAGVNKPSVSSSPQSDALYRQIIDTASDLIFRTDAHGFFTFINPYACNKFGYQPSDIVGKHFTEFIHQDYKDTVANFYSEIRRTMQIRSYYEYPAVSKSGDLYWLGQNIQLIVEDGRIKEITSVARDITNQVETEKAIRTARTRLANLIANLQSAVLLEDENDVVLLANQQFTLLFGLNNTSETLKGKNSKEIILTLSEKFPESVHFSQNTTQLKSTSEPRIGEEFRLVDGTIIERDYIPIYVDEKHLGQLWNYRDVTEKRMREATLRRSEEKYRGIIERMELGLIELDPDHTIVKAYDLFCAMVGYEAHELEGKNVLETFLPPHYAELFWYEPNHSMESPAINEVEIRRKDGQLIWVLLSGAPILDGKGNITGSLRIFCDITARKKLENDLVRAKKSAEDAQEVEQQFLARMSHEIRTPLNAIIGMAHLLNDTKPTVEQSEYVSIVKNSADHLLGIVSNILDFSKINAGGYELKEKVFDLSGLILSLRETFRLRVAELNKVIDVTAEIDPAIPMNIIGDDRVILQILTNLLNNALSFTTSGSFGIKVKLVSSDLKGQLLEFKVHDTGIGIPPDQVKLIFDNFKQVQNSSGQYSTGTGLGLAITSQFIALQNGKIWVESEEGQGTKFTFQLHFKNAKSSVLLDDSESVSLLEQPKNRYRILVAEDNLVNQKYISALLDKWDIDFILVNNGKEALEIAQKTTFDLILMDISMPEMDGFEASIFIKKSAGPNQRTPIIALTASALLSTKEKAFNLGMEDFLTKPFKPFQLLDLIQNHAHKIGANVQPPETFTFNNSLDTAFLEEVYDGDLEYAVDIFEIFLTHSLKEVKQLRSHIEKEAWELAAKLAHKLKPTFSMVGLTGLEPKMLQIEKMAGIEQDTDLLSDILHEIECSLQNNVPKLEEDLKKMRNTLNLV